MGEQEHLMSAIELEYSEDATPPPPTTGRRLSDKLILPSKASVLQTTKRALHFLLPSFLHFAKSSSDTPTNVKTSKPLHPTAWLDGMRGIAALLVHVYHLSYSTHDVMTAWTPTGKRDFLRLPLIRFFYNGHFMVSIFFVLSGYALSYKPVKQIRKGEIQPMLDGLASSVFRRWMRLYLPCLVSTLMIVVLLRVGAYDWTRETAFDDKILTANREVHPQRLKTLSKQMRVWGFAFLSSANPFMGAPIYLDGHLWTIPLEYVASIGLYVTQLGLCGLRTRYRLLGLLCLLFMAHQAADSWTILLFYSGFLLAELDIRRRALSTFSPSTHPFAYTRQPSRIGVWSVVYVVVFVAGLYLGGQPEKDIEHAPGWTFLASLIPKHIVSKHRYWCNWGAMMLIWSTSNSPAILQKIFTNRVSQYLGKISFSLYLCHGMVIHTLHYTLMPAMWTLIGRDTWLKREIGFAISAAVVTVVLVWISDVFMRVVDTPSVKFARWVEEKAKTKVQAVKEELKWMEGSAIV